MLEVDGPDPALVVKLWMTTLSPRVPLQSAQELIVPMSNAARLLVVDDDLDLRDTLSEQLRLCDEFEVLTAGTAGEAADLVKGERVDLGIMDVGCPTWTAARRSGKFAATAFAGRPSC